MAPWSSRVFPPPARQIGDAGEVTSFLSFLPPFRPRPRRLPPLAASCLPIRNLENMSLVWRCQHIVPALPPLTRAHSATRLYSRLLAAPDSAIRLAIFLKLGGGLAVWEGALFLIPPASRPQFLKVRFSPLLGLFSKTIDSDLAPTGFCGNGRTRASFQFRPFFINAQVLVSGRGPLKGCGGVGFGMRRYITFSVLFSLPLFRYCGYSPPFLFRVCLILFRGEVGLPLTSECIMIRPQRIVIPHQRRD